MTPGAGIWVVVSTLPLSRAAEAVTILNTDPGG